ncbi:OsmC family protein [Phototrophicus methaneseepsis]|uniref:OsmC family protein n=1 Tax=Phototrophicus methaneseepsis TaxID=2710758 RepID=A0A7S8IF73_9CHLR|nr:OsmC family protein [Phototrophicus methaneseepsis]QPC82633.1 OsmC family protein [Phototrophicus methaneseepsis]
MAKTYIQLGAEGYRTRIQSRDHVFYADEPVDSGGENSGPMPTELLMGALGACIAITCRLYAERKKWPLEGIEIELDYERFSGKDYEGYIGDELFVHEISKFIAFKGDLTEEQRERLLEIAGRCPVHRLIALPSFFKEELVDDIDMPAVTSLAQD